MMNIHLHVDLSATLRPKPHGPLARYKASSDGWPQTLSGSILGRIRRTPRHVLHGPERLVKRIPYSAHVSSV